MNTKRWIAGAAALALAGAASLFAASTVEAQEGMGPDRGHEGIDHEGHDKGHKGHKGHDQGKGKGHGHDGHDHGGDHDLHHGEGNEAPVS